MRGSTRSSLNGLVLLAALLTVIGLVTRASRVAATERARAADAGLATDAGMATDAGDWDITFSKSGTGQLGARLLPAPLNNVVLVTLLSLLVSALIFVPLEWAFTHRRQPFRRREWTLDLLFFAGQQLLWGGLTFACTTWLRASVADVVPARVHAAMALLPWWALAALAIITTDVTVYWFHRACHRWGPLWRIHRVHHSVESLDWLAAHREHPLDGLLTAGLGNLPAFLLGIPLVIVAPLIVFRAVWAVYIHSNARLPIGSLRMLLGAPELHHWHHARVEQVRHNFSNLAPWTDLLFGTYHHPREGIEFALGVPGEPARSYGGHLLAPFRSGLPQARKAQAAGRLGARKWSRLMR